MTADDGGRIAQMGPDHGVAHLVVARESVTDDLPLLEGMVKQTLRRYAGLPGRDRLLAAGVDPVLDPAAYGARLCKKGQTRAWLFEIDGTHCLYSRGSAAKADIGTDNGFIAVMIGLLDELKPANLYLATFSRLIRSAYWAGDVYQALHRNRVVLHAGDHRIDVRTQQGQALWSLLTMFAAMERDAIVMRLTLGTLARYKRDQSWILGPRAVPFGYRLHRGQVVPVPEARPHLRRLIQLMGDPTRSAGDIAQEMGKAGVRTVAQNGGTWGFDPDWAWDGRPLPRPGTLGPDGGYGWRTRPDPAADDSTGDGPGHLGTVRSPHVLVARFTKLLDTYETGRYTVRWRNQIEGAEAYADVPVVNDKDGSHLALVYDFGLPDGGWATAQEIADARAARAAVAERGGDGRRKEARLPFLSPAGRWERDGDQYAIVTAGHPAYTLRRRKALTRTTRGGAQVWEGWSGPPERRGERIAVVGAAELHRSVANGLAAALAAGVEARRDELHADLPPLIDDRQRRAPTRAQRRDEARRRARQAADKAAAARDAIYGYAGGDPAHTRALHADAERLAQHAERLAADAAALHDGDGPAPAPAQFDAEPDLLLAVLAGLASCDGPVPNRVAEAISQVVTGLRLEPDGLWVRWTASVRVVADGDVVVLGPATGRVPQRLPGSTARDYAGGGRARETARALMTTDDTPAALRGQSPRRPDGHRPGRSERERAVRHLAQAHGTGLPAAALMCEIAVLDARRALWDALEDDDGGPFGEHLKTIYTAPDAARRRDRWMRPAGLRPDLVELVRQHGGTVPTADVLAWLRRRGSTPRALATALRPQGGLPAVLSLIVPPGACDGACPAMCRHHSSVRNVLCPHCADGTFADFPLPVPECPAALLCRTCRRMPAPTGPVFPAAYLDVTRGSAAARADAVNPPEQRGPARRAAQATPGTPEHTARAWARETGFPLGARGSVTAEVMEAYQRLVVLADPAHTATDAAVRAWGLAHGHPVGERGPLPNALKQAWADAHRPPPADRVTAARVWAQDRGMPAAGTGPVRTDVLSAYDAAAAGGPDAPPPSAPAAGPQPAPDPRDVRAWAAARDMHVPAAGRLPGWLVTSYLAATAEAEAQA